MWYLALNSSTCSTDVGQKKTLVIYFQNLIFGDVWTTTINGYVLLMPALIMEALILLNYVGLTYFEKRLGSVFVRFD